MTPPIVLATQVPLGAPQQPGGTPPVPGLPIGIGPPNTLQIPLASGEYPAGTGTLDLTTLTGLTRLEVIDPLGNVYIWTPSIIMATPATATLSYAFSGNEFAGLACGTWRARVMGAIAGGLIPFGPPSAFPVLAY